MLSVHIDIYFIAGIIIIIDIIILHSWNNSDCNLAVCSSTRIPNTCTRTHTEILANFKLAVRL